MFVLPVYQHHVPGPVSFPGDLIGFFFQQVEVLSVHTDWLTAWETILAPVTSSLDLLLNGGQFRLLRPEFDSSHSFHELPTTLWFLAGVSIALTLQRFPVLVQPILLVLVAPVRQLGDGRGLLLVSAVPPVDVLQVGLLVDPGLSGSDETVDGHVHTPVELLDHEGADQEARPVEAVGAVDPHYVQRVVGDVVFTNMNKRSNRVR